LSAPPRPRVFLPGPTALHPLVGPGMRAAEAEGLLSESHRSPRFRQSVQAMNEALRELLGIPPEYRILLVGSASEAMERIIQGTVEHRSVHLVNGAFARRMRDVAGNLGREAWSVEVPDGASFEEDRALTEAGPGGRWLLPGGEDSGPGDPPRPGPDPEGPELLAMTQNETSTGARIPPDRVHVLSHRARARGLAVAVDLVTGWPTEGVEPARIDCGFFSVQKAFGLPAGLGVMVCSPELLERARTLQGRGVPVGGYFGLPALAAAADKSETRATPNMLAIHLLRLVSEAYARTGRDALERTALEKARRFWAGIESVAGLRPFVRDDGVRSRTVLVVEVNGGSDALRNRLADRGFMVGDGYGPWKGRHLRVANFPVQTLEMIEELVGALAV
jgi:phosphoserine aminotransferase